MHSLGGPRAAEVDLALAVVGLPVGLPVESVDPAIESYRMGRWARLTLSLTVLAAVMVIAVSLTAGSAPRTLVDVTVGPGDTLWSIAAQVAPDRDPRDVIDEIRDLNDMQGGVLPVGVVLRVPADAP